MTEETKADSKSVKKYPPIELKIELITEYGSVNNICSKCGDKKRTDGDNKVYCPHSKSDCPFLI